MKIKYFEFSAVSKIQSCGDALSNNGTLNSESSLWTELYPDGPCDIDKLHLIYIKSSGKPQEKSSYVQQNSGNILWFCCQKNTVK